MRLTGGEGKGRKLLAPPSTARPTPSRVRESLFQILSDSLPGSRVLDLFAGSGLLGLESLARGANEAVFVESNNKACNIIKKNIDLCGFTTSSSIIKGDVFKILDRSHLFSHPFDLVFADPPYERDYLEKLLGLLANPGIVNPSGKIIYEAAARKPTQVPAGFRLDLDKVFGDTRILFFQVDF